MDKACEAFRALHPDGAAPTAQERGLLAACAAMCVMSAVMPLDVVVRRLQAQGCPGHPLIYSGPLHAFATIAREEGLGAFYRGRCDGLVGLVAGLVGWRLFVCLLLVFESRG